MHELFDQSINDHPDHTSRKFNSEFSYVYHCSEEKCSQDEVLQFQQTLKINTYKCILSRYAAMYCMTGAHMRIIS